MSADRIVLCMRWGPLFPPDYVNVMYSACRNAISGNFRFVCLTDDADGFDNGIEAFPIPDIGLSPEDWFTPGVWPKLALYVQDLHGLKGRCLFIDLDMIVVGRLDEMFEQSEKFVTINAGPEWRREGTGGDAVGTGVIGFDIGMETQILEAFQAAPGKAMREFANEQDFVATHASNIGFWPKEWVISFKGRLRQPIGVDLFLDPKVPPEGTKVVAFHGKPRPIDLVHPNAGFWDRFPHMGHGQVSWVRDYWVNNGGRIPPFE